ncbi:MAG: Cof-type HAD-IIB family hydrolase [Ruminococcaceae bacterium]|nr:Cof-type HAD-IIB family hydrolase [Oscillospiraceae bacterium]
MKKSSSFSPQKFDLQKTLFVSDLDGTLLGKGAVFPEGLHLPERINALTERGIRLTYATARTIQTVKDILAGITFTAPVALMNGVLIRDMIRGEYLSAEFISAHSALSILEKMEEMNIYPFIYTLRNDELSTSHTSAINPYMRNFMEERIKKYNKPFTLLPKLSDGVNGDNSVIYIVMMDTKERLAQLHGIVEADPSLKCAFYKDSYEPDIWYLEIFSASASKGAAVRRMKEFTGAENLVVFGDNTNDLPMFEESDFSCAVENAADEVKKQANLVIENAEMGGVVNFLEKAK